MQQVKAIVCVPTPMEALRRRDAFCRQWATPQSALVACLLRAWNHTVIFFRLHLQFPNWSLLRLRTTCLLERVNRLLPRLFRAAGLSMLRLADWLRRRVCLRHSPPFEFQPFSIHYPRLRYGFGQYVRVYN